MRLPRSVIKIVLGGNLKYYSIYDRLHVTTDIISVEGEEGWLEDMREARESSSCVKKSS